MSFTQEEIDTIKNGTPDQQNSFIADMDRLYDRGELSKQEEADYVVMRNWLRPPPTKDTPEYITTLGMDMDLAKHLGQNIVGATDEELFRAIQKSNPNVHSFTKTGAGTFYYTLDPETGQSTPTFINKDGISWADAAKYGADVATILPAFKGVRVASKIAKGIKGSNVGKAKTGAGLLKKKGLHSASSALATAQQKTAPGVLGTVGKVLNQTTGPHVLRSAGTFGVAAGGTDLARQMASKELGYRDDIDKDRVLANTLAGAVGSLPGTYLSKTGLTKPLGAKISKKDKALSNKLNIPLSRAKLYNEANLSLSKIIELENSLKLNFGLPTGLNGLTEGLLRSPRVLNRLPLNQEGYNILSGHSAGRVFTMPSAPEIAGLGTVGLMKLSTDF